MEEQPTQELTKKERKELRRAERDERHRRNARAGSIKKLLWWAIGAVVILGGSALLVWAATKQSAELEQAPLADEITAEDHVIGNRDSSVVLLEYGDFECPACGSYHPVLKQLKAEYGDRVAFVYRHFPLNAIHKSADISARATEAAALQGKFWEMHDKLFENQKEWTTGSTETVIEGYAQEVGLNMEQFRTDINSEVVKEAVEQDRLSAIRSTVNSTPTFFLNGEKIQNPRSVQDFKGMLDTALSAQ
ncbi:MAG: thioredoxin domain-containing protein [Candidatus Spechtbacterales bacterium]